MLKSGCIQILAAAASSALMAHLPQANQIPMAWLLFGISIMIFLIALLGLRNTPAD